MSSSHREHADKAWGGNVITLTKFLRPSMHFGPWSSARSHSLGQPMALSTSTTVNISVLPSYWASLRSQSLDRMSFLIFRGWGQLSASRWRIAAVKLEWKCCSRSQHSQIRQTELISSDKDARVKELTVSLLSSEEIFLRKFSFLVRHNALADPSPITMEAGVLEYHLSSFRSLLLSSPKKESSVCIEFCDRHHIGGLAGYRFPPQSDPTMVRDLLGRCPYFRRQKKQHFLAFMMLWSIGGLAERSWFHR